MTNKLMTGTMAAYILTLNKSKLCNKLYEQYKKVAINKIYTSTTGHAYVYTNEKTDVEYDAIKKLADELIQKGYYEVKIIEHTTLYRLDFRWGDKKEGA